MTMPNGKLGIAPLTLALAACGDMLTETPKSFPTTDNFYKTPADIRSATLAAYQPLNTGDLYNWWLWLTTDLASDQVRMNPDEPNFGTYHPEFLLWDATNSSVTAEWNGFYNIIFRANLVLGRAPNVPFPDETERLRLLAEAKFLRGYSYFMLAKLYDDVPLLVTEQDHANFNVARAPVAQVEAQAAKDLTEADYRKAVTYRPSVCSTDPHIGCVDSMYPNVYKYRPTNGGVGGPPDTDFPLYRYAEAILIHAEAQNELGNTPVAVQYLNMIRA